jgi:hypothetical protein
MTMRLIIALMIAAALAGCASKEKSAKAKKEEDSTKSVATGDFQDKFEVDKSELSARGMSKYMILQPGRRAEYEGKDAKLVITVLPETRTVDGVETAVVEERESEGGKLKEVSRNFFAINRKTGDVYYFGEDVDVYDKEGKIIGHPGAWISGQKGARFGLLLPSQPKLGQRYYAEVAPDVAMDRCEVKDTNARVATPLLGTFNNCLKIDETTPIEKGISHKVYAPNVGLIQDDEMIVVRVEGGGGM